MLKVPLVPLGNTGLRVSKLGFGTFDFGVAALNISPEQGGQILSDSYKLGVNFWDSSEDYGSHPHIAFALRHLPRKKVIISTKTNAKDGEEATKSLKNSLEELQTDYLDIFQLHLVRSDWIEGSRRVLKELGKHKINGVVKAIGLSTHSVTVVNEASKFKELDVIMTICCGADQATINRYPENIPLEDGSIEEMFRAINLAHRRGKGVIAMKILGTSAPPLMRNYRDSIKLVRELPSVDTMVIGMKKLDEVRDNVKAILSS